MWQVLELEQWSCAGVVTGKRLIVEHRRAIKSSLSFLEISANMYAIIIINQWHAHPFEEMETRTRSWKNTKPPDNVR